MAEKMLVPGNRKYKICTNCVMDTTDEGIAFGPGGVCMRCREYGERIEPGRSHGRGHEKELAGMVRRIRESREGRLRQGGGHHVRP